METLALESDSFTENISPFKEFRVNSKRKRKFKRSGCEPRGAGRRGGVIPGKRKRSAWEKSVESGDPLLANLRLTDSRETEAERMELEEEERSSSSLSSSKWEDLASDEGPPDNDDREADDETHCFYLPHLRFHWVGGCWGRTQDSCDY